MTDLLSKARRILELAEKATPGPWQPKTDGVYYWTDIPAHTYAAKDPLSEFSRDQKYCDLLFTCESRITAPELAAALLKCISALEWYGHKAFVAHSNTSCGEGSGGQMLTAPIDYDQGQRARDALKELE